MPLTWIYMYVILGRGQSEKWNADISTDIFHRW